ncbi:MAG: sigma-70 family RNA polymerase sigma factor, partial [Myxococcales bacterium]|nr:sigma-70 family RNA polymerase sigma factor [Myxococcales bacterium]
LQVVLELHYWEQCSVAEIASALEIPQGTVKSRLRRGREALREVLASMPAASALPALDEHALAQHMHALRSVLDEG